MKKMFYIKLVCLEHEDSNYCMNHSFIHRGISEIQSLLLICCVFPSDNLSVIINNPTPQKIYINQKYGSELHHFKFNDIILNK